MLEFCHGLIEVVERHRFSSVGWVVVLPQIKRRPLLVRFEVGEAIVTDKDSLFGSIRSQVSFSLDVLAAVPAPAHRFLLKDIPFDSNIR